MTYFKGFTSDLVKRWRNVKAKAGSLLNMASYSAVQFLEILKQVSWIYLQFVHYRGFGGVVVRPLAFHLWSSEFDPLENSS